MLTALKRFEEAIASYSEAVRLDPFDKDNIDDVARGFVNLGHEAYRAGDLASAVAMYDRALQLDVTNAEAIEWKAKAQSRSGGMDEVAALRAKYDEDPDDFERVRALDHALARLGRFAEIIPLWERYIARHPNDARAYFERAGTNHHLKNRTAAVRDATKACELGHDKGCKLKAKL